MKRRAIPIAYSLVLLLGASLCACKKQTVGSAALPLDFHQFFTGSFQTNRPAAWLYEEFHGFQMIDGLPFEVNGYAELYGSRNMQWHAGQRVRDEFLGIPVHRKFDELHLIHEARFRETSGCTLATLRINYSDGTKEELPIRYGVHLLDISRLLTEEQESLTDPDTKIIWRGKKDTEFFVNYRLFKSRLLNPHPEKSVQSLDFLNAKSRASYVLVAATVTDSDPNRPITPALPLNVPARDYDGMLTIQVVDDKTGAALSGADCDPYMKIDGASVVGDPVLTPANGEISFKYPSGRTEHAGLVVKKPGYETATQHWPAGTIPKQVILRLIPKSN